MISSFSSGRAWRYYRRIVLIALDQGMSRIVLTLICGPVWLAVGDKSQCQVLVILADLRSADREAWCQNELPSLAVEDFLCACRCLPLCLSSHFIVSLLRLPPSDYPSLSLCPPPPAPQMDYTPAYLPLPTLLFSTLQLIAASADYFIQCGPLRASSPGFGRALISHVNIPFIGLNITQHLPPSRRPPGSPCPVRTADYWEG